MNELDFLVFIDLFKAAYEKCFGYAMKNPMTETESKVFCNKVLEQMGLSIGWKSVKNYSFFIIDANSAKAENPSVATLDTLSRYVLGAPYTNEIQRKNDEGHHPYWFLYKEKFQRASKKEAPAKRWITGIAVGIAGLVVVVVCLMYFKHVVGSKSAQFTDYFNHVDEATMAGNGWFVKSKDTSYWNRRGENHGELTLFTLRGDNWPDLSAKPEIKNLLLRKINSDCFAAEVHLTNFRPGEEWQQAGILLLEDTILTGKSVRLSIAFNDYFAGITKPKEILVQAIICTGTGFSKPEEIVHRPILYPDSAINSPMLNKNLENPALKIEKHGNKFRFLFAGGARENGAYKELASQDFDMHPSYIGIFAIKGFTNSKVVPARFKFFSLTANPCN
jgi:hypothetical protein